jgi:hypothetical protein
VNFYILDEREVWHRAAIEAAARAGHIGKRIFRGHQAGDGIGFIRCHAVPEILQRNHQDFVLMDERCQMIQDADQVMLYEDKSGQFEKWGDWMPETGRFTDAASALEFANSLDLPIISKADVGASSKNVRVLTHRDQVDRHIELAFGSGIEVHHCAGGFKSMQKGYVLLQRFVPHDVTWRVNAIGNGRAIFKRYNYRDKPVAQTGNVEPVMQITDEIDTLLQYANAFFEHAGTRWCAVDILRDGNKWKILETSLAWPWPSPGQCNLAPIFGTRWVWAQMFDAMFTEFEAGAWA